MIQLKRDVYEKLVEWKESNIKQVLLVEGARQVGKTFIVQKFAEENYKNVIYINLLAIEGKRLLSCYKKISDDFINGTTDVDNFNFAYELFIKYNKNFKDTSDTIIIVDEIQESYEIYNTIRQFARDLTCDVIVTGSYLGRVVMNKEFWSPMGDLSIMQVNPLTFKEFLNAFDMIEKFQNISLYGKSDKEDYESIKELFQIYCEIGGYPQVVVTYKETKNVDKCKELIKNIIRIFCEESARYFTDIIDKNAFEFALEGIANLLAGEKKGFKEDSFNEALQKIIIKDYSSNIDKASCNRVINWLNTSKIISYCNKVIECDFKRFKANCRCYFADLGVAEYLLSLGNVPSSERSGIIHENFIFNVLKEKNIQQPAFATLGNGELDFIVRNTENDKVYGIEVKSGKNSGKTISDALKKGKIDYALYAKGNTYGGIDESGKIITIPIYLFERDFEFMNING